ncbi:MAG: serine/threonine-protein kinase [Fuerstiella sp.]
MSPPDEETDFHLIGLPQPSDDAEMRGRADFEILATQFVDELRAGERPSIENYARRYPQHAAAIRESFSVLALLEQTRAQDEAASIRRSMPKTFHFKKLGRCELLCEVGRGGMGVVFQARDHDSNHVVAVKVLPWRVNLVPEWQRRFEEEARTTAKLRHRNIVPVFRFGQEHGYCYYVMQFVNGIGLDAIIRRFQEVDGVIYRDEIQRMELEKPKGFISNPEIQMLSAKDLDAAATPDAKRSQLAKDSWKSFTQLAIQSAQALRYAHGHGLLHNDIKPGNVLLDASGRVWITDFGLSCPMDPNDPRASPGLMGTLRYMAPERLLGTGDARSDIYSLGITLYELVTLRPAFRAGSEDELIRIVMEEAPANPRQLQPSIPKGLETIILNCIAKHPTDRYESTAALLGDLLRFAKDQKIRRVGRSAMKAWIDRLIGENQHPQQ